MKESELIENLNAISIKTKHWTYLQTIGVSQKETVMAEVLKYFFQPNQKHGLKDIFIKALLETQPYRLNKKEPINPLIFDQSNFEDAKVRTEATTDHKKRLDILVTSKQADTTIGIEFKINHSLNNPLELYTKRILDEKNKTNFFIILTPYWKEPEHEYKNSPFVQIILSDFIKNVEIIVKKEKYFENKNNTYQYYIYNDFINTIKNRGLEVELVKAYSKLLNNIESSVEQKRNDSFKIQNLYSKNEVTENGLNKESKLALTKVKTMFESKVNNLFKVLKNNQFEKVNATSSRLDSAILKKLENGNQLKIRLTLGGWFIEFWESNEGEKTEPKVNYIGNYFKSQTKIIEEAIKFEKIIQRETN